MPNPQHFLLEILAEQIGIWSKKAGNGGLVKKGKQRRLMLSGELENTTLAQGLSLDGAKLPKPNARWRDV